VAVCVSGIEEREGGRGVGGHEVGEAVAGQVLQRGLLGRPRAARVAEAVKERVECEVAPQRVLHRRP
jgi:hypothetical protein